MQKLTFSPNIYFGIPKPWYESKSLDFFFIGLTVIFKGIFRLTHFFLGYQNPIYINNDVSTVASDHLLGVDDVLGVLVPVYGPVALHVLDDGDDDRAIGAQAGQPEPTVSERGGQRGRQLHGGVRQAAAGLDAGSAGRRHVRVLFRHAAVRVPGRRVLQQEPREIHRPVFNGSYGHHDGADAIRVTALRQLEIRHVPQIRTRVRGYYCISLLSAKKNKKRIIGTKKYRSKKKKFLQR